MSNIDSLLLQEPAGDPVPGPEFNYVRIKRGKVTWFLDVNIQGTVSELKATLVEAMGTVGSCLCTCASGRAFALH